MGQSTAKYQRSYVSCHIDQTYLVEKLLRQGIADYDDIEGWKEDKDLCYPDIYQWKIFPKFTSFDYEKLIAAEVPVLYHEYETWVGVKHFGSPFDLYFHPELINILFGDRADEKYKKTT